MPGKTIREVLTHASTQLHQFDSARLDSEILLSSVMNRAREFVYSHPEQELDQATLADFNSLLAKRTSGYPLAYLTGSREFWSLQIRVDHGTLIPRPETEHLVEAALALIDTEKNLSILDLGTGSGAIAIAIARERPLSRVMAIDISSDTLNTASSNAQLHNLGNIQFLQSDWYSALGRQKYDLILSNPPYVKSSDPGFSYGEIRHEPRLALDGGLSGLDAYHQIIPQAIRHLNPHGRLILEHGNTQAQEVRNLLQLHGYSDLQTIMDYSGHERLTMGRCP